MPNLRKLVDEQDQMSRMKAKPLKAEPELDEEEPHEEDEEFLEDPEEDIEDQELEDAEEEGAPEEEGLLEDEEEVTDPLSGDPVGDDESLEDPMMQDPMAAEPLPPASGSPLAQSVTRQLQDPVMETKKAFAALHRAKLQYELKKAEMVRELAPVKSIIQHVEQLHQLEDAGMGMPGMPGMQPGMAPSPPPNMTQAPGRMQMPNPQQSSFAPGAAPAVNPPPKVPGQFPGQAPGPQQSKFPPKKGMPSPGGGEDAGAPDAEAKKKKAKDLPPWLQGSAARRPRVQYASAVGIQAASHSLSRTDIAGRESLRGAVIHADHMIGDNELRSLLTSKLQERYGVGAGMTGPWIDELYPFEDYFVYQQGAHSYKQGYTLDKVGRSCKFVGEPERVKRVTRYEDEPDE